MSEYRFVTRWTFDAAPDVVFAVIGDVMTGAVVLPRLEVTRPADVMRVGERVDVVVHSPFGYRLAIGAVITDVVDASLVAADAGGALRGRGVIALTHGAQGGTDVRIDWDVDATLRWMRRTRVLAPVYRLAHGIVMRRARRALARLAH